jgi:hypothetical protein
MITEPLALGSHLYFFRNGAAFTLPSAGTCSVTSKPGAGDNGWVNFGRLKSVSVEKKGTTKELWAASPGQLRRFKIIETKKALDISFTSLDMSDLAIELAFGTAPLTAAGTQFNPLEGAEVEGWLKGQVYDHRDAQVLVIDMWVFLKAEGQVAFNSAEGDPAEWSFMAYGLQSSLNTGTKRGS